MPLTIYPGGTELSYDGQALRSDHHMVCYNLIMYSPNSRASLMAHVNPAFSEGLSHLWGPQRQDIVSFFNQDPQAVAFLIAGDRSKAIAGTAQFVTETGVNLLGVFRISSQDKTWGVQFHPSSARLEVYHKEPDLVPLYDGYPLNNNVLTPFSPPPIPIVDGFNQASTKERFFSCLQRTLWKCVP